VTVNPEGETLFRKRNAMLATQRMLTISLLVLVGSLSDTRPATADEKCVEAPILLDDDYSYSRQPLLGFSGHVVPGWGMMVDSVRRHSPASRIGLEPGDVVVRINGQRVCCYRHYLAALRASNGTAVIIIDDCRGRGLLRWICDVGGPEVKAAEDPTAASTEDGTL
jgi:hypothetical protein